MLILLNRWDASGKIDRPAGEIKILLSMGVERDGSDGWIAKVGARVYLCREVACR